MLRVDPHPFKNIPSILQRKGDFLETSMNRDQLFPRGYAHVVGMDEPKSVPFNDNSLWVGYKGIVSIFPSTILNSDQVLSHKWKK